MSQFQSGDNPKDHSVSEVMDYVTGDDCTPDEYDRIMSAERDGKNRVGIIGGSGVEEAAPLETPAGEPAAGPNEAATGQESPADQAKTVDDPQASGDAGVTADKYPDDAPASLGPDMPQSAAELAAHDATIAAAAIASVTGAVDRPKTQTPEQALAQAAELAKQWKTPRNSDDA